VLWCTGFGTEPSHKTKAYTDNCFDSHYTGLYWYVLNRCIRFAEHPNVSVSALNGNTIHEATCHDKIHKPVWEYRCDLHLELRQDWHWCNLCHFSAVGRGCDHLQATSHSKTFVCDDAGINATITVTETTALDYLTQQIPNVVELFTLFPKLKCGKIYETYTTSNNLSLMLWCKCIA